MGDGRNQKRMFSDVLFLVNTCFSGGMNDTRICTIDGWMDGWMDGWIWRSNNSLEAKEAWLVSCILHTERSVYTNLNHTSVDLPPSPRIKFYVCSMPLI